MEWGASIQKGTDANGQDGRVAILFWTVLYRPLLATCLTVVSPLLASFGVVEITLGIIAEVLIRMHYEVQNKAPYRIRSTRNLSGVHTLEDAARGQARTIPRTGTRGA